MFGWPSSNFSIAASRLLSLTGVDKAPIYLIYLVARERGRCNKYFLTYHFVWLSNFFYIYSEPEGKLLLTQQKLKAIGFLSNGIMVICLKTKNYFIFYKKNYLLISYYPDKRNFFYFSKLNLNVKLNMLHICINISI